jgi:hypothetical protein
LFWTDQRGERVARNGRHVNAPAHGRRGELALPGVWIQTGVPVSPERRKGGVLRNPKRKRFGESVCVCVVFPKSRRTVCRLSVRTLFAHKSPNTRLTLFCHKHSFAGAVRSRGRYEISVVRRRAKKRNVFNPRPRRNPVHPVWVVALRTRADAEL